ncbi:Spy/CpxP family protein refolding chaperone [Ketobacter alkanivorans]|nr:periplasmic heavy metal sensor [Ketobacter alkanivorans]
MRTFIALVISAVIAIPVLAMPPGDGSHMLKGLTRHLDLSEEQQAQVKAILDAKKPQMDAIHKQMQALKAETDGEIKGILTTEQVEKFESMQEKRKERFKEKREHRKEKLNKE